MTLPGLGFSKVKVVDAVEIHVLCVPGERALPHPEIKIWSVDSFDCDSTLSLHHVQNSVQTANIPLRHVLYTVTYIFVITAQHYYHTAKNISLIKRADYSLDRRGFR